MEFRLAVRLERVAVRLCLAAAHLQGPMLIMHQMDHLPSLVDIVKHMLPVPRAGFRETRTSDLDIKRPLSRRRGPHVLAADGIDSVVLETRSREYVESRIRVGILESSTVGCSTSSA